MPGDLSWEQEIRLARLALELRGLSREALIARALELQELLLLQQGEFHAILMGEGIEVSPAWNFSFDVTEDEVREAFGREPTDEEFGAYLHQRIEAHQQAARLDVDIEAIALGLEE